MENQKSLLFYSIKGPGATNAPLLVSLFIAMAVGFIAQRSRFCTMGAFRDLVLFLQNHLLVGVCAFVVVAFITNPILSQFHPGFSNQPIAHNMHIWNFMGTVLAGLCFCTCRRMPWKTAISCR